MEKVERYRKKKREKVEEKNARGIDRKKTHRFIKAIILAIIWAILGTSSKVFR